MRFGLFPPVLTRIGGDRRGWDAGAGIDELATIARTADRLGYHWLSFPEHVAIPDEAVAVRGTTYWATLPTMGYLASVTARIRLTTGVIVLGYHHPLDVVKSYGTLDRICGGRVILGVGVGSLQPEFELLGAPFSDRGPRADDAMRAIRAVWGQPRPSYRGEYYAFDGWVMDPAAPRTDLSMWVGGRTGRSLRRAATLGDGWMPFGLTAGQLRAILTAVPVADLRPKDRPGFDVVLPPESPLDPIEDATGTQETIKEYAAIGATMCDVRFRHRSLAHYLEQLEALTKLMPDGFDGAGSSR